MQRALQQARAEAAAQAQGNTQPASDSSAPQGEEDPAQASAEVTEPGQQSAIGTDKKALGALLKRAAQKMQQEEAGETQTPAAVPTGSESLTASDVQLQSGHSRTDQSDDPAAVNPAGLTDGMDESDTTQLLPKGLPPRKAPSRGLSLGEKLGSILRNALSLPRQNSYVPCSGEDSDDEGIAGQLEDDPEGPSAQRVLPRDASYLPEWLNRTLRKGSTSARSSAELSRRSDVSRADSVLPEWVDASALQQTGQSEDDTSGLLQAAHPLQKQQHSGIPELFTKALKPVPVSTPAHPPEPLITAPSWPPTEAEASAAASRDSRQKRLLAFWQQQQPAAAALALSVGSTVGSSVNQPASPVAPARLGNQSLAEQQSADVAAHAQAAAVNQVPPHAVHARSRPLLDSSMQIDDLAHARQIPASHGTIPTTCCTKPCCAQTICRCLCLKHILPCPCNT